MSACGPDAPSTCRAFERALCERSVACNPSDTLTACTTRLDAELACAEALVVEGNPDECFADVADMQCADLDAQREPPSCDGLRFRR